MQQFLEFIDRKQREAHKHLRLLEQLLRHGGMQVKDHIDEEDSYIFVKSPNTKLSFDGMLVAIQLPTFKNQKKKVKNETITKVLCHKKPR